MAGPARAVCGTTARGRDPLTGYGRINGEKAIVRPSPKAQWISTVGQHRGSAPLVSTVGQLVERPKMREGRTCIATIFRSVAGPYQIWAQTVPVRAIDTHGPITSGCSRPPTWAAMS